MGFHPTRRVKKLQIHFISIVHVGWTEIMWPFSVFNVPVQMFNAVFAKLPDFLFGSRTITVNSVIPLLMT